MSKWKVLMVGLATVAMLVGCPKFPELGNVKAGPVEVKTELAPEPSFSIKVKVCGLIGQWEWTQRICPAPEPEPET